jgi:pyruvate formate lyase activating enzyme
MDIKNAPEKYAVTAGLRSMDTSLVRKSLQLLLGQDRTGYEFRTTVVAQLHTAEDFEVIGRMIKGAPAYYLQPFTDRETVPFGGLSAPSASEMERYAEIVRPYVGRVEIRGMDTAAQS